MWVCLRSFSRVCGFAHYPQWESHDPWTPLTIHLRLSPGRRSGSEKWWVVRFVSHDRIGVSQARVRSSADMRPQRLSSCLGDQSSAAGAFGRSNVFVYATVMFCYECVLLRFWVALQRLCTLPAYVHTSKDLWFVLSVCVFTCMCFFHRFTHLILWNICCFTYLYFCVCSRVFVCMCMCMYIYIITYEYLSISLSVYPITYVLGNRNRLVITK